MYWQDEEQDEQQFKVAENVIDLIFDMQCSALPVDHAFALSQAVQALIPWFADEPNAALHLIHGAETGNGWERPQGEDALIYLSRRSKFILRLPAARLDEAEAALSGQALKVAGHTLKLGKAKRKLLAVTTTLYSRYLASPEGEDEEAFIGRAVDELRAMGLRFKKVLAGKSIRMQGAEGALHARSLLVAEMPLEDAVTLQERGLGNQQYLGLGVFTAHKPLN